MGVDSCPADNGDEPSLIVTFDHADDPGNPRNWPGRKKGTVTVLCGLMAMGSTWSSGIFSTATKAVAGEFSVSVDVAHLGTSLFLVGFGTGPLLWAPLSEIHGRRAPMLLPYLACVCFTLGTAISSELYAVFATRFLAGFFGSAPTSITGGVLADMYEPRDRGLAMICYAGAVVGGPVFAPVAGSSIAFSGIEWRWTHYVTTIYMATILLLSFVILEESYAPTILVLKARRLRLSTGKWAYHAEHEEWNPTFREMATKFLLRPLHLFTTPICFLFALHASFVYSIAYLNLGSFPIIFHQERGWNEIVASLPFLALIAGIIVGAVFNVVNQGFYLRRAAANNGRAPPEVRLPPRMAGAVSLAGGLFLVGNTASLEYHWIAPVLGAALMGFGFFTIFPAALNYTVDTFPSQAASAVAANTFSRSIVASIFPPLVSPMYTRMGVVWASNMLGILATIMVPIPWLFFYFGKSIRAKGALSKASL